MQLKLIWGITDAAMMIHWREDSSNTGNVFMLCQPHEEEKEKRRSFASTPPAKILFSGRVRKNCLVMPGLVAVGTYSYQATLDHSNKDHDGRRRQGIVSIQCQLC